MKNQFYTVLFLIILATDVSGLDMSLSNVLPNKSNAVPLELQESKWQLE